MARRFTPAPAISRLNAQGNLVDSNGNNVMGYSAVNGAINTSQSLAPIVISSGQTYPPNATSNVQLDMNLDATGTPTAATGTLTLASAPTDGSTVSIDGTIYTFKTTLSSGPAVPGEIAIEPAAQPPLSPTWRWLLQGREPQARTTVRGPAVASSVTATPSGSTLSLKAVAAGIGGDSIGTTTNVAGAQFTAGTLSGGFAGGSFSTPITVYDSLGSSHVLNFNFNQTSSGNWNYQVTIPAADVGATGNPQVVGSGTLQFGPSGNLISPSSDVTGIAVPGLADGAKPLNLTWQLFSSPTSANITQTAQPSATSGTVQNGYSAGTLESYAINSSGVIDGVLSNGQTVSLAQIALATFPNSGGLTRIGSNDYQTSLASGSPSVGIPGAGGRGSLDGGALEQSNVDIATAFTQLIQAERGYQANAKAITTADDLMQSSIALIQG